MGGVVMGDVVLMVVGSVVPQSERSVLDWLKALLKPLGSPLLLMLLSALCVLRSVLSKLCC